MRLKRIVTRDHPISTPFSLEIMPHFIVHLYTQTSAFDNTINPLTPLA
jgi:hypothetical protein